MKRVGTILNTDNRFIKQQQSKPIVGSPRAKYSICTII